MYMYFVHVSNIELSHHNSDTEDKVDKKFSNSLIIHQVRTKEITTMKEVWKPGLN